MQRWENLHEVALHYLYQAVRWLKSPVTQLKQAVQHWKPHWKRLLVTRSRLPRPSSTGLGYILATASVSSEASEFVFMILIKLERIMYSRDADSHLSSG